jgi:hypothetical protein
MSKPIPKEGIPHLPPEERLRAFAGLYRDAVSPDALVRFEARCVTLDFRFGDDELIVLAALDTPAKLHEFLDKELYYNDDHASAEQEETVTPPRFVLRTGMAHCFEGAMFAYAVHFLHGREPRLMMLEASQDADHNIVVWRDPRTGLFGSSAQSRYPGLVGRPAEYPTLRALAESYVPFYFSDRTLDPKDLTLVGFSEPINLGSPRKSRSGTSTIRTSTIPFSCTIFSTTRAGPISIRPCGPSRRIGSGSTWRASPSSAWTTFRPVRARFGTRFGTFMAPRTGLDLRGGPARSNRRSSG